MLPKASAVASEARALLSMPTIPYHLGGSSPTGMDCQGMVKYCIRKAGGKMDITGSNAMWRQACVWKGTLAEAKNVGKLVPGALLFIVEKSGQEPDRYKGDGLGDASHVGVYIGEKEIYSIDASKSKGKVVARAEHDATHMWTHAAWFREVDYTPDRVIPYPDEFETLGIEEEYLFKPPEYTSHLLNHAILPRLVRVSTISGRLNLRKLPHEESYRLGGIEPGTIAEVLDSVGEWMKLRVKIGTQTLTGWSVARYLEATSVPLDPS